MAYEKINWQNNVTPINETNLNHMDNQIVANEETTAQKLDKSNPEFSGTVRTTRTSNSDGSSIIVFNIQTEEGNKTLTITPAKTGPYVSSLNIGGTIPVTFGKNVIIPASAANKVENLNLSSGEEFVVAGMYGSVVEGGMALGMGSSGSRSYIKLWDAGTYRYLWIENGSITVTDSIPD